jgi:hypothetical protein
MFRSRVVLRVRCSRVGAPLQVRTFIAAAKDAVPKKRKVWDSVDEAVKDVKTGDIVLAGGSWMFVMRLLSLIDDSFMQASGCVVSPRRLSPPSRRDQRSSS